MNLTEVEIVVVAISDQDEAPDNVDKGFCTHRSLADIKHFVGPFGRTSSSGPLTHGRWVLPKVTSLVSP